MASESHLIVPTWAGWIQFTDDQVRREILDSPLVKIKTRLYRDNEPDLIIEVTQEGLDFLDSYWGRAIWGLKEVT